MNKLVLGLGLGIGIAGISMASADACGIGDVDFRVKTTLNFRTEPSTTTGRIITKLPKDTVVRPIEKKDGWVKFEYKGRFGWSSFNYLEEIHKNCICDQLGTPIEDIKLTIAYTTANLNVREGVGTQYPVTTTFKKGTRLHVSKKCGDWYFVEDGHYEGWSHGKYLNFTNGLNNNNNNVNQDLVSKDDVTYFLGQVNVPKGDTLNLRKDNNARSKILAKLPNGTKLNIKYETRGWLRVECKLNGKTLYGYVSGRYVI